MKTVVVGLSKRAGAGASAAPAVKTDSRTKIVDRDRTLAACFMWDPLSVGPASRQRRRRDRAASDSERLEEDERAVPGGCRLRLDDLEGFDCAQRGSVVEIPHLTVGRSHLELPAGPPDPCLYYRGSPGPRQDAPAGDSVLFVRF